MAMRCSFGRFVVDMSVNASVAGLGVLMLPIAIGALAKHGMGAGALGLLAFMELGSAAAGSLLSGKVLRKAEPVSLCALGGVLAAAGNGVSAIIGPNLALLLFFRLVAGLGTGLMSAGGLALIARLPKPERMYGYIGMAPCLSALLGFLLAPYLISWTGGAAGIFGFQAILGALNALLMVRRKRPISEFVASQGQSKPPHLESVGVEESAHERSKENDEVTSGSVSVVAYVGALTSSFFLALCDASIWAFVGPVGEAIGIPLERMAHVLIICAVVGCGGPLLAARMGSRFGLFGPIAAGQSLMIALGLLMVTTHNPLFYTLALYFRVFTVLFLQPMYQGLYARVDPWGGVVGASFGASQVGYSVGPLIAGQFISIQQHSFQNLGWLAALAAVLSFLATLFIRPRQELPSAMAASRI
jgi:MFS family permease